MISGSVTPLARFIMAITSAFLLARSAFGLPTGFLARPAFFPGFAFLGLRGLLVAGASVGDVLVFSESIVLICFSLPRLRSSHSSLGLGERAREICGD